jgi:hypothetical protein
LNMGSTGPPTVAGRRHGYSKLLHAARAPNVVFVKIRFRAKTRTCTSYPRV